MADNPDLGVVMKGTGGVRKMRWAVGHRGKSGGARIIYYWHNPETEDDEIYLLFAFLKNEQENLTGKQTLVCAYAKLKLGLHHQKIYRRNLSSDIFLSSDVLKSLKILLP